MLSVIFSDCCSECHDDESRNAETYLADCCYAERHYVIMLIVVILIVLLQNVPMLNLIILNVIIGEYRNAECHYVKCRIVESHNACLAKILPLRQANLTLLFYQWNITFSTILLKAYRGQL